MEDLGLGKRRGLPLLPNCETYLSSSVRANTVDVLGITARVVVSTKSNITSAV